MKQFRQRVAESGATIGARMIDQAETNAQQPLPRTQLSSKRITRGKLLEFLRPSYVAWLR